MPITQRKTTAILATVVSALLILNGTKADAPGETASVSLEDIYIGLFTEESSPRRRHHLERKRVDSTSRDDLFDKGRNLGRGSRKCDSEEERNCFNPWRADCRKKHGDSGNRYEQCLVEGRNECCSWEQDVLRKCDTPEERECFNPWRSDCRKKHGTSGRKYDECLIEGRKRCCKWSIYSDLEEGEQFFELVVVRLDGLCDEDLSKSDRIRALESAILQYSKNRAKCDNQGVKFEAFNLLDFEEADTCEEGGGRRRQLKGKKKWSKVIGQRMGKVCRSCDDDETKKRSGRRGLRKCEADLVASLNDYGFIDVTEAEITKVELQDCSRNSPDCKWGKVCCGALESCRCEPFQSEEGGGGEAENYSYSYEDENSSYNYEGEGYSNGYKDEGYSYGYKDEGYS